MSNDNPIPPSIMSEQEAPNAWDEAPEHEQEVVGKPVEGKKIEPQSVPVDDTPPPEEEREIPWEKRYKDMESEFGRRGTKVNELESELDKSRIERLELAQRLQSLEGAQRELSEYKQKEVSQPDPLDESTYYSEEERQTMTDFPELAALNTKQIERSRELLKREFMKRERDNLKQIDEMRALVQKLEQREIQSSGIQYMIDNVGEDWKKIDDHPEFHNYVNKSRTRVSMMDSRVPEDMADVINTFLESPAGANFREKSKEETQINEEKEGRREAAQGLVGKSAPPTDRNPREMTTEELWEETPEYEH